MGAKWTCSNQKSGQEAGTEAANACRVSSGSDEISKIGL